MAITAASHAAWKTGSFSSRSTGPKPCMPPRSCTPSMRGFYAISVGARGRGVRGRGLGGHPGVAGAQVHPEAEARPVGRVDVPALARIDPRIGQEHGHHLLVAPIPEAEAPRARPARAVAIL